MIPPDIKEIGDISLQFGIHHCRLTRVLHVLGLNKNPLFVNQFLDHNLFDTNRDKNICLIKDKFKCEKIVVSAT